MDCAVAFEEFGRAPLPAAVFTAGILSPLVVLEGGYVLPTLGSFVAATVVGLERGE